VDLLPAAPGDGVIPAGAVAAMLALVGASDGMPDGGAVVPSSAWLDGPAAQREPLPSDPPVAPDPRFLEAARADAGSPPLKPFRSPLDTFLRFPSGPDAGPDILVLETPVAGGPFPDGGGPAWLPPELRGVLGVPSLRLAIPVGPEQPVEDPGRRLTEVATGMPTAVRDTGRAVDVVEERDLHHKGARTMADGLQGLPGVHVARDRWAGGTPVLRGMMGARTVVTVDGVRLNNSLWGLGHAPGLGTLDLFAVERVEVVRGPQSVLLGGDALGGAVHVTERTPSRGADLVVHADGAAFFSSADQGKGLRMYYEGGLGPLSLSLGGDVQDFTDLRGGRSTGPQWYMSYQDVNLQARAVLQLWGQELTLGYDAARLGNVYIPAQSPHPPGHGSADHRVAEEQYRDLAYAGLKVHPGGLVDVVEGKLGYHDQRETLARYWWSTESADRNRDAVRTVGGDGRAHSRVLVLGPVGLRAAGGADLWHDTVDSRFYRRTLRGNVGEVEGLGEELPALATVPHGSWATSAGAFLLAEAQLWRRLTLRAGARGSFHAVRTTDRLDPGQAILKTWLLPSAMVQGVVRLPRDVTWSLGLSHGYRPPNLLDLTGRRITELGYEYADPRHARAEHALTLESVVHATPWRFLVTGSGWATALRHPVVMERSTLDGQETYQGRPVYRRVSGGQGAMAGAEGRVEARLVSHLRVHATGSLAVGRSLSRDEALADVPPPRGVVGVSFRPRLGFYGLAQATWSAPQRHQARGYVVMDAGGGYQLSERTGVDLHAQNITDETYQPAGTAFQMPGTSVRAQVRVGF
jgi:hypothetical protein